MDPLRAREQDRWRQDLVSDLGARDLLRDGERKDLLQDPGIRDLIRDAGVRDLALLGLPVADRLASGTRLLLSGQLSGGIAVQQTGASSDRRFAARRRLPSAASRPSNPTRTRRKEVSSGAE